MWQMIRCQKAIIRTAEIGFVFSKHAQNGSRRCNVSSCIPLPFSTSSSSSSSSSTYPIIIEGKKEIITKRRFSSTSSAINNPNTNTHNTIPPAASSNNGTTKSSIRAPLQITGSSYLFPTLRLERNDTPSSIQQSIDHALSKDSPPLYGAMKSMIQGRTTTSTSNSNSSSSIIKWSVPIILDLGAFTPDGSPHYKPPTFELLYDFVRCLENLNLRVVGIANAPKDSGDVEYAASMLGLPSVMSVRGSSSVGGNGGVYRVEDVIRLVASASSSSVDQGEELVPSSQILSNESEAHPDITTTTTHEQQQETNNNTDSPSPTDIDDDDDNDDPTPPSFQSSSSSLPAKVYHGNVRSGQQISAENRSLVILGSVNSGGEVLADGDIHVYGKLKGRALAGLQQPPQQLSSNSARIYASHFDPELVCIEGTYTSIDSVQDLGLEDYHVENKEQDEGGGATTTVGNGNNADEPTAVMVWLDYESGELNFEKIRF